MIYSNHSNLSCNITTNKAIIDYCNFSRITNKRNHNLATFKNGSFIFTTYLISYSS